MVVYTLINGTLVTNSSGTFDCRDKESDAWLVSDSFEPALSKYLSDKYPRVFVDIGANVGKYTVMMAKNSGMVVSIEAEPETYDALLNNIRINNLDNVYAFNVACWSKKEDIELYIHGEGFRKNSGQNSVTMKVSDKSIMIPADTLDNILNSSGIYEVDIVKMDIEGAESEAIIGMKDTIARSPNIEILFEALNYNDLMKCKLLLEKYGLTVGNNPINRMYSAKYE
jgi:FkbM family methyltransferase